MALSALQVAMERAEKKDNFAKEFKKKVREDEKRLLKLLDEEQAKTYVLLSCAFRGQGGGRKQNFCSP